MDRRRIILITIAALVAALILILIGYHIDWTGFSSYDVTVHTNGARGTNLPTNIMVTLPSKTLYDWLQLLIVPFMLAGIGLWFNHRVRKASELRTTEERIIEQLRADHEQAIALDNQREIALQVYINEMSDLLLCEKLHESEPDSEVRYIARARMLTTLSQLDGERKASVLQFLYETKLIGCVIDEGETPKKKESIVDLENADLCEANLHQINLDGVKLSHVNLIRADVSMAQLNVANLQFAQMTSANLRSTNFMGTNLSDAGLTSANLAFCQMQFSKLCKARLHDAKLDYADLSEANLTEAKLLNASLIDANLSKTILVSANLQGANLSGVNLEGANLKDARNITVEELEKQAKTLKGAIMPDGSKHP